MACPRCKKVTETFSDPADGQLCCMWCGHTYYEVGTDNNDVVFHGVTPAPPSATAQPTPEAASTATEGQPSTLPTLETVPPRDEAAQSGDMASTL